MKKIGIIFIAVLLLWMNSIVCFADENTGKADEKSLNQFDLLDISGNSAGVLVVVGEEGMVLTSEDGIRWTRRVSGTDHSLNAVTWGDRGFVAVGEGGCILLSKDGINWASAKSPSEAGLQDCTWDGRQYAAVGSDGTVLLSRDGMKWQRVRLVTGESLFGVKWLGNQYIATAGDFTVLQSEDGVTWEERIGEHPSTIQLSDTAYNGSVYIVAGDHLSILLSGDGKSWGRLETPVEGDISSLGEGAVPGIWAVEWGKDRFVAVGQSGLILNSSGSTAWKALPQATRKQLNGVVWDGKQYIAVGDEGTLLVSSDGENWVNKTRVVAEAREHSLAAEEKLEGKFRVEFGDGSLADGADLIEYTSSDPGVAEIGKDGTIVARKEGTAVIKATYDLSSVEVTIQVTAKPEESREEEVRTTEPAPEEARPEQRNAVWLIISIVSGLIAVASSVLLGIYYRKNRKRPG
jgi:hypothetical protein